MIDLMDIIFDFTDISLNVINRCPYLKAFMVLSRIYIQTPMLPKQHAKEQLKVCYYYLYESSYTIFQISLFVNSKDGVDFAMLFALQLLQRLGKLRRHQNLSYRYPKKRSQISFPAPSVSYSNHPLFYVDTTL